jgi:hypothetical protein
VKAAALKVSLIRLPGGGAGCLDLWCCLLGHRCCSSRLLQLARCPAWRCLRDRHAIVGAHSVGTGTLRRSRGFKQARARHGACWLQALAQALVPDSRKAQQEAAKGLADTVQVVLSKLVELLNPDEESEAFQGIG